MTIAIARAPVEKPGFAALMDARKAAMAAAADHRKLVKAEATEARSSTLFTASDVAKSQARSRVQQIAERLKLLKKMFAMNPREMARALAQAFKELKAALKDYKAAGGQEMAMSGAAAQAAVGPPAAPGAQKAEGAESGEVKSVADTHALYDAVAREVRTAAGEDGLEFMRLVRGLSNAMSELLETARTQARGAARNDKTDEAVKESDEALEDLRADLAAMEQDLRREAPMAGMTLSVEA